MSDWDTTTRRHALQKKYADGSETRTHLRAGLIFYQTGDFPKALWHLRRGLEAPDANPDEFEGVDFKGILNDCRRRARGE